MATITTTTSLSFDAAASLTVGVDKNFEGRIAFTSANDDVWPSFTVTKPQSKTYGPFGIAMTVVITVVNGSLDYTINGGNGGFGYNTDGNITGLVSEDSNISFRGGQHRCVVIGDSIALQDYPTSSGGYLQWLSNAVFQAVNYRLKSRLHTVGVLGLSGNRSDQIYDALPAFLDLYSDVGFGVVVAGHNDVIQYVSAPRTVAQYKATMIQIISELLSRGIRPILFDLLGSASTITTAAMSDMWIACSRALKDIARQYPDVILVPFSNAMTDVTASYPANLSALSDGSFHPNSLGAKYISDYAYSILDPLISPVDIFDSHYHAGSANELALTANPMMQGSTAGTGGMSGVVPTGGLVTIAGTGTGVGSLSQNTAAPTGSQWASVAYTGPASAVNGTDYVGAVGTSSAIALATAGLAVGDVIQGFWELDTTGTIANFMGAEIFLNFVGATGSVTPPVGPSAAFTRAYGNKQNNSSAPLVAMGSVGYGLGVLSTPQMPIPTGTTAIQLFCRAYPVSGSSGATFTIKLGRNTVRKVYA